MTFLRSGVAALVGVARHAIHRRSSASTHGSGQEGYGLPAYDLDYRIKPRAKDVTKPWPDPPDIENPAGPLEPRPKSVAPRAFDVDLFEQLNREYAVRPLVAQGPRYDATSVIDRSRQRLLAIHRRIDLAGKTVLEIGCGSGLEVWHVAHAFDADAWGIDILARRAWPDLQGERVHLIEGDIAAPTSSSHLAAETFDRVYSNTVWEHIEHPRAAFAEVFRVMRPGGLAWIRANLYRGPTASHRSVDIHFPFPHLLFQDDVIAGALRRAGKPARGAAWVNRLTWEQYEAILLATGFEIKALRFDHYPLDEEFYARFEDVLGRYPRQDLERGFFTAILRKPG